MPPDLLLPLVASLLIGGALFAVAWWVARALASEELQQGDQWRYDVSRMNELRRLDLVYRLFQPLVLLMAQLNRVAFAPFLPAIGRELQAAGLPRFWLPEEYLAKLEIVALLLSPIYVYGCVRYLDLPGVMLALMLTALTAWLMRRRLASRAKYRILLIKRR